MNARVVNLASSMVPVVGAAAIKQAVGETAAALPTPDAACQAVLWSVDGGTVRVWFNGDTPTAAEGHLISDKTGGVWSAALVRGAKLIAASGTPVFYGTQMEG